MAILKAESEDDLPPPGKPSSAAESDSRQRRLLIRIVPLVAIAIILFLITLFGGLEYLFHNHSLTQQAVSLASSSPEVTQGLGEPLSVGWAIGGSIRNDNGTLQIPIKGPKGSGTLTVSGNRTDGKWHIISCVLQANDGERSWDLLVQSNAP